MAVHAHPDDESSKGAATMARYVREDVQVLVCTLTGGERGDILNPAMDRPEIKADIAAVRRAEMARAREILGVEQRFLGFVDSGLPEGDPKPPLPEGCFALTPVAEAAEPLVRAIREFRPHVMLTYDEQGRLPAPGPRDDPRGQRGGLRGGRRPGRVPGFRRALAFFAISMRPGPERWSSSALSRSYASWVSQVTLSSRVSVTGTPRYCAGLAVRGTMVGPRG